MLYYLRLMSVVVFCKKSRLMLAIRACLIANFWYYFKALFDALIPWRRLPSCLLRLCHISLLSLVRACFRLCVATILEPSDKVAKHLTPKSMPTDWTGCRSGGILSTSNANDTLHLSAFLEIVNVWLEQRNGILCLSLNSPKPGIAIFLPGWRIWRWVNGIIGSPLAGYTGWLFQDCETVPPLFRFELSLAWITFTPSVNRFS